MDARGQFGPLYCQACTSVLQDRNTAVFTNCGHLICCTCHDKPDVCPICNAQAQIIPIAQVATSLPHLEGLFLDFGGQKERFKRQFLISQAKAFDDFFVNHASQTAKVRDCSQSRRPSHRLQCLKCLTRLPAVHCKKSVALLIRILCSSKSGTTLRWQ